MPRNLKKQLQENKQELTVKVPRKKVGLKIEIPPVETEILAHDSNLVNIAETKTEPASIETEQPKTDNKTEATETKATETTTTDLETEPASIGNEKELDKVYSDSKGKFVYKLTNGKRMKPDSTYANYIYKRKYYFKEKKPGPVKANNRIKLRSLLKLVSDSNCETILNFMYNNNIIKKDESKPTESNSPKHTNEQAVV